LSLSCRIYYTHPVPLSYELDRSHWNLGYIERFNFRAIQVIPDLHLTIARNIAENLLEPLQISIAQDESDRLTKDQLKHMVQ
jgi:hypothetical protein